MIERGGFGAGDIVAVNRGENVIDVHVRFCLSRAALSPRRVVLAIGNYGFVGGGGDGGMEMRRRRSGRDKGPGRSGISA